MGQTIPVNTLIGIKNQDPDQFKKQRFAALPLHFKRVTSVVSSGSKRYHFDNPSSSNDVDYIESLKLQYLIFRETLSKEEESEFEKILFTKYVFGTSSIEGNTYTEEETERLLNNKIRADKKTDSETAAISNYLEVREFIRKQYDAPVSESLLKRIHSILMKGLKGKDGKLVKLGEYREDDAEINGVDFDICQPEFISDRVKYAILDYNESAREGVHPVELASTFHQKFEEIHPFSDGNGRTGREIVNFMLKQTGYPEIYIPPSERDLYLAALSAGNRFNFVPLIDFTIHRMIGTLLYLATKTSILRGYTNSADLKEFMESTEGGKELYPQFRKILILTIIRTNSHSIN